MTQDRKTAQSDTDLFRRHVGDLKPHRHDRIAPYRSSVSTHPVQTTKDRQRVIENLLSDSPSLLDLETGDEMLFMRPGVTDKIFRKLRRGQFPIENELDLHGLTTEKASIILGDFLLQTRQNHQRCVRIIHGKGLRSPGKKPVLKAKLDRWLRQRDEVLAFCTARSYDGGTGAVYVLLKK